LGYADQGKDIPYWSTGMPAGGDATVANSQLIFIPLDNKQPSFSICIESIKGLTKSSYPGGDSNLEFDVRLWHGITASKSSSIMARGIDDVLIPFSSNGNFEPESWKRCHVLPRQ